MSENDKAFEIQTVDRLIAVVNNGDDGADATQEYRSLMQKLDTYTTNYGGKHKGKIVITINLAQDAKGVEVTVETKVTDPRRPKYAEHLFSTGNGTLTTKDPARGTMFEGADLGRRRAMPAE